MFNTKIFTMFLNRISSHTKAVLQALFVTFLWSTSWVLIKIGLADIPALTFAGLRYSLAFVCLLPLVLRALQQPESREALRSLSRRAWGSLVGLGLLYYAVTQGAQFVGLDYLPAISVSLMLNFTSPLVALLGIPLLGERPTFLQWGGMALFLAGVLIYFTPLSGLSGQAVGFAVVGLGVLANALSSVLGRDINRSGRVPPLMVTAISMGIGAFVLLAAGWAVQGLPRLALSSWLIIIWLAVVNTALAFTLWNHTLRTLSAVESSIINGTMLVQIAVLAWLFLDEAPSIVDIAGLLLAGLGALVVQVRRLPGSPALPEGPKQPFDVKGLPREQGLSPEQARRPADDQG